ncbi:MAG: histidinol-phosphatase HisJ family protein, partial [Clostridium paraputrificum]
MKWLKDGHMHSHYCPHGTKDTFKEYVEKALEVGLNEITFTEHMPLPAIFMDEKLLKECSPNEEEILLYLKEATKIKEEYKDKIKINVGLEIDYV